MDLNPNFKYIVYKTTNKINGKMYVGCHKTLDPNDDYIGSGTLLKRAIRKYGRENFIKEVLFTFDSPTAMFNKEREIVDKLFVEAEHTYNILIGGSGGFDYINSTGKNVYENIGDETHGKQNLMHGRELKRFLSEKGMWGEFCKKTSEGLKQYYSIRPSHWTGRKHKMSSRKKVSETMKKVTKGEKNSQYGTCWVYSLDLKKSLRIKKDDLCSYLEQGFLQGRKMNF